MIFPISYDKDPYCDTVIGTSESPPASPTEDPCRTFTNAEINASYLVVEDYCNSFPSGEKCCTSDAGGTTVDYLSACWSGSTIGPTGGDHTFTVCPGACQACFVL